MIAFNGVSKQYGKQVLFLEGSFRLNAGGKAGLVGPNGAGKTTVFRMIVGEESPDEGEVTTLRRLSLGYYRQDIGEMSGRAVLDEPIASSGTLGDLHHELEDLEAALADPARAHELDAILERFGHVQEAYERGGGYDLESRAREILHGLGFADAHITGDVGALSGGWKMRVGLARILLGRPDPLLMDEPTNHLDIESILWLERFIRDYPVAVLMTCHDKDFMNRIVDRIVEIDGGAFTASTGDYDLYVRERAIAEANREAAHARQQAILAKERRFIERFQAHTAKAAQAAWRRILLPHTAALGRGRGTSRQAVRLWWLLRRVRRAHGPRGRRRPPLSRCRRVRQRKRASSSPAAARSSGVQSCPPGNTSARTSHPRSRNPRASPASRAGV